MMQASLVAVEDAHSRRPRCAYFGELEQMDATPYDWVPGQTWHLHLAIDDATGAITGAWFDTQETLNGTGGAILLTKDFVGDEPFAVLLGDDVVYNEGTPALQQLMEVYDKTGKSILGCQEVAPEKVSSYGIVQPSPTADPRLFKALDMIEKPALEEAPSRLAVLGRYIINPEIFGILEQTKPGRGGEIQLTDALQVLAQQQGMYAYNFQGRRYDVGDKEGFLEATVEFALRREDLRDKFADYLQKKIQDGTI